MNPSALADSELEEELPEISGEAGQVVAEKYRLERVIGRGAMGTVWEAEHLDLEEKVAVKLVALVYSKSSEARQRFKVEATAAARLRSRFAVHVYDTGETDAGVPYLAMELLEGETLEQRLKREGALPILDVARITTQVARGLSRAHALGIVHRDLKPANIFLARSGDEESGVIAKVLDFGIAKMTDINQSTSTTRTGTVLGTPQFMSPEQVRGLKSVDYRADLYSLGAVVFYMATGKLAFEGEAFGDLLLAICTRPLPIVHDVAPGLPPELDAWFQMACAREPDQRFHSAEELAETLCVAAGVGSGGAQRFIAGGATLAHGTLAAFDSIPPPPVREPDELPTVRRSEPPSAPKPMAGTVGTSGVLTLGSKGKPRRALWPVAAGGAFILLLGVLVFSMAFSAPKRQGDDASASATSAAAEPPAAAASAPATAAAPASSAPDAAAEAASQRSILDLDSAKHRGHTRVHRRYVHRRRRPHKPDLGF